MIRKLLYTAGLVLVTGAVTAQSAQSVYSDAFSAYEAGNYAESLQKASEVEKMLGSTNAKLQSLKALNYYENGDQKNALLQLELYFNTQPDTRSSAYSEMAALREEIRSGLQSNFESSREQLERKREEELAAITASFSDQKDLLAFDIAREAGSLQALELFLKTSQSDSLKQEAQKLIEVEKQRLAYNSLVEQGMDLLARNRPSEAKEAFLKAAELHQEAWLQQQIDQAKSQVSLLAYTKGLGEFYSGKFREAVSSFQLALENEVTPETRERLQQAEEEFAFFQAFNNEDPAQMQAYLDTYAHGSRRNQAEAFLFHHYINQVKEDLAREGLAETEASLGELSELRTSPHWKLFSATYYELLQQQADQLTKGSRKKRMANIGLAIVHFEELDTESGERYRTRLSLLKYKQKEWARPDMMYVAFKTDPTFNDLGLEFASHNNSSLGFGISLQFSKQLFSSDTSKEFELGELDHVRGMANFSLTKKVLYPLWLYAGAGWANLMPILPTTEDNSMGVIDEENDVNTVNFLGGVNVHFKPVVFTLGASYPYLSEEQKLSLGLEKNPVYITLGAGLGW